ncbi:MAG TPA: PAS domain S-box protein [Burkholderiales bacterium]|nr:PAS domain S-box protein [Burkholderiales bacterium]
MTKLKTFELLERLPVPMFVKARDGRYLGVNKAWEELFGMSRESFVGKQVGDLYPQHPEIAELHATRDRELWARPGAQSYPTQIVTPDGRRRETIYYKATYPSAGEAEGLVGAIFDVTARARAESALRESEERFRAVVDSANEGMLIYDRSLNIIAGNRAAERIVGLPLAELIGKPGFTSLLSCIRADGTPLAEAERPTRVTVRSGKPQTDLRIGIKRAAGAVTWLSVNTAFLRRVDDTDYYGLVSTVTDVTEQTLAGARLKESEARFRRTFELAGSGMAHIGMDRRFIRVNRRLCGILGYSEAEMLNLTGRQISHPDDLDIINEQRPALHSGEIDAVRLEKRYLRKDGAVVWVKFSMTLERDAEGRPLYEIAVYDDITAQRDTEARLKESEARFRQTFELAASGICHVVDGRFVRVNKSLCEILGYSEKELLGKSVKEVSHPEDRDVTDAGRARIRAGEIDQARFEKRYLRKDGSVVWCDLAIALVRDVFGMPLYEIAVFDDITERKKSEAALHAAHEELKRSNAELEQFAYVASHDLQEPLRMVASYTQLLGRRYEGKLDKDAHEFMSYIVDGATRMKQLIEDLLAYSRVGTKGAEFKPVALEAPLRRALFNLRAGIEEAGAAVTYDPLPTVQGDEVQLGQLMQNLVGNSLKFRSNSVPRIHVGVSESPGEFQIEVRDNGIGIEPQYYERIFMVFQRLFNKGEYPGTGIGLAICKKVVERHGGRIWVESRPGDGSSFHFTLPKRGEF